MVCFGFLIWGWVAALQNRITAKVRTRSESELRDRDTRLDTAFQTAFVGDWTWDVVKNEVSAHPVVWTLYGEAGHQGTAPASWFEQRQHPEDQPMITAELQQALAEGKPFDIEFRVIQPDGTARWICCRGKGIYSARGELLQTSGINFDITRRKEVELRLRESEEMSRKLADAMPQIVWTADPSGAVDYYNQRWYEYVGARPDSDWEQFVHPDDIPSFKAVFYEAIASGLTYETEFRLRRDLDAAYRWQLLRAVPICDAQGRIQRWFGTCTDIEDFKQASEQLKQWTLTLERRVRERSAQLAESEYRYRLLLGGVREYAILMLDEAGTVISWNSGAERIFGYRSAEIIGTHFSAFFPTDRTDCREPAEELAVAVQTGRFEAEGWRVRKQGERFWANVVVTPVIEDDGQIRGFSKVTRDISDRRAAEELAIKKSAELEETNLELSRQTRRAEEASLAKSSFLASMSHEIRTPMNAILGMADLLWETELNAVQRDYVNRFRRAGGNLLTLINDILDLSKIEAGHFELESVDFDLHELLERTLELMEARAQAKGLELVLELAPGVPRVVTGDPARLQQILNNLVGNAIKFTPRGKVHVAVERALNGAPERLQFSIVDTGIGISGDKLAMIFEDFVQAENSITRRFGGTGLGLAICRRLVKRMGGDLGVSSVMGSGSTFFFNVKLPPGEREPPGGEADLPDFTGCRVLVLDNDPTNRLIVREMCSRWGMTVDECESKNPGADPLVTQAVDEERTYSLAFLGCLTPTGDGLETLKQLQRFSPHLPVVLITSHCEPGDAARMKTLGAAACLSKPVRSNELLLLVSGVLREKNRVEKPAALTRTSESTAKAAAKRILIAEDSDDNRFLLGAYLEGSAYELTFVENGRQAVEAFGKNEFDLVLMDIQMPVMDGLSATVMMRTLELERSLTPIPIIALTAHALLADVERSLSAGCDAHLCKPISKEKLTAALNGLLAAGATSRSTVQARQAVQQDQAVAIPEGFEELSRNYLSKHQTQLSELLNFDQGIRWQELRSFGHNIKGTGTSYGFPTLTRLGAAIEAAASGLESSKLQQTLSEADMYMRHASELASKKNGVES